MLITIHHPSWGCPPFTVHPNHYPSRTIRAILLIIHQHILILSIHLFIIPKSIRRLIIIHHSSFRIYFIHPNLHRQSPFHYPFIYIILHPSYYSLVTHQRSISHIRNGMIAIRYSESPSTIDQALPSFITSSESPKPTHFISQCFLSASLISA